MYLNYLCFVFGVNKSVNNRELIFIIPSPSNLRSVTIGMPSILNAFFPLEGKVYITVGLKKNEKFEVCVGISKHETVQMGAEGLSALYHELYQLYKYLKRETDTAAVNIPAVEILLLNSSPRKIVLKSKKTYTTVTLKLHNLIKLQSVYQCLHSYVQKISRKIAICEVMYSNIVQTIACQCKINESEIVSLLGTPSPPHDPATIKILLEHFTTLDDRIMNEIAAYLERLVVQEVILMCGADS